MALPHELAEIPDDTDVKGDIDAFMEYVESGQAAQDWNERIEKLMDEMAELF